MKKLYIGFVFITLVVIAAVIYGLNSSGSPMKVRKQKFDQQRVSDLYTIKQQIQEYYYAHNKLPEILTEIVNGNYPSIKDPENGNFYEYEISDNFSYKLCASFSSSSEEAKKQQGYAGSIYTDLYRDFQHKKGFECFTLSVNNNFNTNYNNNMNYNQPRIDYATVTPTPWIQTATPTPWVRSYNPSVNPN